MHLFRRIIAVVLVLLFIIAFIPALFIFRVNSTVARPDFYADQLRRADVYNFIHTKVLPSILDRASVGSTSLSWMKPYALTIAQQAVPPDWLQAQAEQVIYASVPYAVGDTQSFTVTIPLKSRVEISVRAIKDTLHNPEVFDQIYDQFTGSLAELVLASTKGTPLLPGTTEIRLLIRSVFPPDWILRQVDGAIDVFVPYITGDKDNFTIRVSLADRADSLRTALTDTLKKPEVYDYIVSEVVVKPIKQVQQSAPLPAGVMLTDSEILSVVKQAMPFDWYQARVPDIVGQLFNYLTGRQPNLDITISIADRKPVIADAVAKMIDQKLPLGDVRRLLGINISAILTPLLNAALPNQLRITDSMIGGSGTASLATVRQWFTQGFTYTDAQLKASLGPNQALLDSIRQQIATGLTFTERDLRAAGGEEFESVRTTIGTARHLLWMVWLVLIILLAGVGLLGGRRWGERLVWAGAALAVASVMALIVFGPVFAATVQSPIDQALAQSTQPDAFTAMLAGKGAEIAHNAVGSFIGGLRVESVVLLLVAIATVGVGAWHVSRKRT